jgi:acyl-CoA reductase-like NAD-dependent aldehyde dehydrogenase
VASVISFRTEEEGVRLANATRHWPPPSDRRRQAPIGWPARSGRAGWVNTNMTLFNETPFGGNKASGMGRERA